MSLSANSMKIVRISCNYVYLTPTKRKNIWQITFQNTSNKKAKYVIIEANSYLPMLEITDSQNRKLMVVPRHRLPKEIATSEYTMFVVLEEPIDVNGFGTIYIKAISTLGRGEEIPYDKYLFGYTYDPFSPEIHPALDEECSWYIAVFAPKGYELRIVLEREEEQEYIYRDERSYIFRTFSKQAPNFESFILIPWRVTSWLLLGLFFSIVVPLLAFPLYFYTNSLTISFSMILGTIAAIIAMRAWLFYSVELLDKANKVYLASFLYGVVMAGILLVFCTHVS